MINNDTVVTSTIFGIGAGLMTEQWITIAVGAIAVGVIQPFFRIVWTNILLSRKTKRGKDMAYGKKRKSTKKRKEDPKKKRTRRKRR